SRKPRLLRAPIGAAVGQLAQGELKAGAVARAGSPLAAFEGREPRDYLRRGDRQISLLRRPAGPSRLTAWWGAATAALKGHGAPSRLAEPYFSRDRGGFVPLEVFDRVWPWRRPVAPVLRALLSRDVEAAERLDCLAMAPEDLALCSIVCPDRRDYGGALAATLERYRNDA
ncbi:MAG: hypothetical protein AAFX58_13300, partial [Pseudomonadota bacterium]